MRRIRIALMLSKLNTKKKGLGIATRIGKTRPCRPNSLWIGTRDTLGAKLKAMPAPGWMQRQHGTLRNMKDIRTHGFTHCLSLSDLTTRNIACDNVLRYSLGRGQRCQGNSLVQAARKFFAEHSTAMWIERNNEQRGWLQAP